MSANLGPHGHAHCSELRVSLETGYRSVATACGPVGSAKGYTHICITWKGSLEGSQELSRLRAPRSKLGEACLATGTSSHECIATQACAGVFAWQQSILYDFWYVNYHCCSDGDGMSQVWSYSPSSVYV